MLNETLYWIIADANPGNHDEDFANEVAMIVEFGYNAREAIDLIANRSAYVVGSDGEFESKLFDLLG